MHPHDPGANPSHVPWPAVSVACIWLPQFPLRVELLRHPAWDGLPLVLGAGPGERKVVQLCSPEAARAGIFPGLPLREVLTLCREAIIIQPDPVRIAAVLDETVARLQRVSPAVEPADEAIFLDLRGLRTLYHDDLARLERAIRTAVPPPLRPRLGAAAGKFAASVAAHLAMEFGLRVVPAPETAAFLAPLPLSHLPLLPETIQRLKLLGLHTMADLAALPFPAVQAEFGPPGARAWRLASGQDAERLIPRRFRPPVQTSLRFDDPLASIDAILIAVGELLGRAFAHPLLQNRAARQARLRALLADGTSWERLITFKDPVVSSRTAYLALKAKLQLPNGLPLAPLEELAIELLELSGEAARQPSLFLTRARQLAPIAEAASHLGTRYGRTTLYHAMEVEPWSRIPERRWALVPYEP